MKYIIVKGSKESGKYTTINEVCKRLKPEDTKKIKLPLSEELEAERYVEPGEIYNGNYLLTVKGNKVLVVSVAPTKQKVKITTIIKEVVKTGVKPDFAIVSMRGRERLDSFDTARELDAFGKCIYETKIWRIPSIHYKNSEEWNKRIAILVNILTLNL